MVRTSNSSGVNILESFRADTSVCRHTCNVELKQKKTVKKESKKPGNKKKRKGKK